MLPRHRSLIVLALLLTVAALLAACTMRAPQTVATPTGQAGGGGQPTGGVGPEATMAAVRSEILTQTAQALEGIGGGGGGDSDTATPVPTALILSSPTPVPPPSATPPATAGATTYTVKQGDWIYAIARQFGVDPLALIAANPGIDPNHIEPGQVLNIPARGGTAVPAATVSTQPRPATYVVQKGDWVYSIARKFGVDPSALIAANNLTAPYTVYPGQELKIP